MSFAQRMRSRDVQDKWRAIKTLQVLLECAGCAVGWEELQVQLDRMNLRALLNLKYRIERALENAAAEEAVRGER